MNMKRLGNNLTKLGNSIIFISLLLMLLVIAVKYIR